MRLRQKSELLRGSCFWGRLGCRLFDANHPLLISCQVQVFSNAVLVNDFLFVEHKRKSNLVQLGLGLEQVVVDHFFNGRSLLGVLLEHVIDELRELRIDPVPHFLYLLIENLVPQFLLAYGRKRVAVAAQLVQYNSKSPNVWLLATWQVIPQFRCEVVRSTYSFFSSCGTQWILVLLREQLESFMEVVHFKSFVVKH